MTVFHPVGHGVSYANYRQRLEVKTFAFVSGDKALPGLVGDILLLFRVVSKGQLHYQNEWTSRSLS